VGGGQYCDVVEPEGSAGLYHSPFVAPPKRGGKIEQAGRARIPGEGACRRTGDPTTGYGFWTTLPERKKYLKKNLQQLG